MRPKNSLNVCGRVQEEGISGFVTAVAIQVTSK
jgi:hypothetical protein